LLSGGLDSATASALARREGFALYGLTVRYGQVHAVEIAAARAVAASLGFTKHIELDVDLKSFGGSSLVGDGEIPQSPISQSSIPQSSIPQSSIPSTYVPARNTVMLSLALAWAEVLGAASASHQGGHHPRRPRARDRLRPHTELLSARRRGAALRPL